MGTKSAGTPTNEHLLGIVAVVEGQAVALKQLDAINKRLRTRDGDPFSVTLNIGDLAGEIDHQHGTTGPGQGARCARPKIAAHPLKADVVAVLVVKIPDPTVAG